MENEITAQTPVKILSEDKSENSYLRALKKNEEKVLQAIKQSGFNVPAMQLYRMSEDFFHLNTDKFIFEDLMGEDHCPILSFSDTLLETVFQKTEKFASGKTKFFETARIAAQEEKYLLQKERVDDIIIKCCLDGKNPRTDIAPEIFSQMTDLFEFNASSKSLESATALLESLSAKIKKELSPKGLGPFKKKISDDEKEKILSAFEKNASRIFDSLSRIISSCIENGRSDFYDMVSPLAIEKLFVLIEEIRKSFGRNENGNLSLHISYEEFLLQFINYYVAVAQKTKSVAEQSFVPISNWKLNEGFRILGEYSSNPGIQYQLIEKYAKEKNNTMIYFPFEIISGILCKSDGGWDINIKCLDVLFEVAVENEKEKPKIEKLITQVVCDSTRNPRVRSEAFVRYFNLINENFNSLVSWLRDSIVPEVFRGDYSPVALSVAKKILSLETTQGSDDGLDATRQKCVDYLKNNYESDALEILNTIKTFLCSHGCKNHVLKERIYEQFFSTFGDSSTKKIQFNREILEELKTDESAKPFLYHVCSSTLDLAGEFSDSQKMVLRDTVDYLLLLSGNNDMATAELFVKFIYNGKENVVAKDSLKKICTFKNDVSKSICFLLIEKICKKNEAIKTQYHCDILKIILDDLLHNGDKNNLEIDKMLLTFLGIDFSDDEFSLSEFGKKSVNYLWEKNEAKSPLWKEIKFDYIQTISKCRNVEILQYAFEKACK